LFDLFVAFTWARERSELFYFNSSSRLARKTALQFVPIFAMHKERERLLCAGTGSKSLGRNI
jgi:uncharacterized protein (DUF2132 family)